MKGNILNYLSFIGIYVVVYFFLDIIPISIDFYLAVVIGFIGMISVFIVMTRKPGFNSEQFYKINLIFVFIFCVITVIYENTLGLTEYSLLGNSVVIGNSQFYNNTLSLNHSIILGTIILLIHSIIIRKLKPILIVLSTIAIIFGYLLLVV
jgi:hypothetical protein